MKRIISLFLALLMVLTTVPANVFAEEIGGGEAPAKVIGDINGDNKSDLKDLHILKGYVDGRVSADSINGVSVDGDSGINKADFKALQLILVGAEHVITFYDDNRDLIDVLPERITDDNELIGQIPTVGRSSRDGRVLTGYHDAFDNSKFFADKKLENAVNNNPVIIGEYEKIATPEEVLTFSSFANMEATPEESFKIVQVKKNESPKTREAQEGEEETSESTIVEKAPVIPDIDGAYSLEVKDGSGSVELEHGDPDEHGIYTIKAKDGFKKGATYELTLADGWNFVGDDGAPRTDSVRSAVFEIKRQDEVTNLKMNSSIKYIEDTAAISYYISGNEGAIDVLRDSDIPRNSESSDVTSTVGYFYYNSSAVISSDNETNEGVDEDLENQETEGEGTETETTTSEPEVKDDRVPVSVGDTICIYTGTIPTKRDIKDGKTMLDPAVYVKVTEVEDTESGRKISFARLNDETGSSVYNIVDNFPIKVSRCPVLEKSPAARGKANIEDLDIDAYKQIWEKGEGVSRESILEEVYGKLNEGDFVTFYEDVENFYTGYEPSLFVAEITRIDTDGYFEYKESSIKALDDSMETYIEGVISGEAILTDVQIANIEAEVQKQVNSGEFQRSAGEALLGIALAQGALDNVETSDEDGNSSNLEALGAGRGFELTKTNISASIINKGAELHFTNGLQLRLDVEATFEVEAKEGTVQIDLSSSFIQEVELIPTVKSSAVKKLGVPVGVHLSANIDLKSYTNMKFEADIYTVAPDKKYGWINYQKFLDENADKIGDELLKQLYPKGTPEFLKELKVSDVIEAVEKIKVGANSEVGVGINDTLVNDVWDVLSDSKIMGSAAFNKKQIDELNASVVKTTISTDFNNLLELGNKDVISSKYSMSVRQLMEKYADMINKDTDWIKIVEQEIGKVEASFYGITVGVEFTFNVYTDISMAIGSNIEYEVGKRFSFWFEVGLFKPHSGSSVTDIIDERFAFQFYVMGRLGVRAGVEARLHISLVTSELATVGVSAEVGPYLKLYGFFIYDYTKNKPLKSAMEVTSKKTGALYLDFGLYFTAGIDASVLNGLASYNKDLADEELSLLTVGEKKYYFESAYVTKADENYYIVDSDKNSNNGIEMPITDEFFSLRYIDLVSGTFGTEVLSADKFNITMSNPDFRCRFDDEKGKVYVSVTPPEDVKVETCDMTISYKGSKLAFSQYDMTTTIPLIWTNLSESERNQYYTVKVRVGNDLDGYDAVWSKRVLKGQPFNLPTDTEIRNLIEYDEMKYVLSSGYGTQKTRNLTVSRDTVYDYCIGFREYGITVDGIQNEDGTIRPPQLFKAKYGKTFDFYSLKKTGTYQADLGKFTKFAGVTTDEVVTVNGKESVIDLSKPITGEVAAALIKGITANANYVDDSVTATFELKGVIIKSKTETVDTKEVTVEEEKMTGTNEELSEEEASAARTEGGTSESDTSGTGEAEGGTPESDTTGTGEAKSGTSDPGDTSGTGETESGTSEPGDASGTGEIESGTSEPGDNSTQQSKETINVKMLKYCTELTLESVEFKTVTTQEGGITPTSDDGDENEDDGTGDDSQGEKSETPKQESSTEVTETSGTIGEPVKITVRRGTTPSLYELEKFENKQEGSYLISVSPNVGDLESDSFFTAVYGAAEGEKRTIKFEPGDGASRIRDIHRIIGQPMTLPTPKNGDKEFEGWYKDKGLKEEDRVYSMNTVPDEDMILYAKWSKKYLIKFNANGGNDPSMDSKEVKSGTPYGQLASVSGKDASMKFSTWTFGSEDGMDITPYTIVSETYPGTNTEIPAGAQIELFAKWEIVQDLEKGWFKVPRQVYEYDGAEHPLKYSVVKAEGRPENGFIVKYRNQSDTNADYTESVPVEKGVYDVQISLPEGEGTGTTADFTGVLEISYKSYEASGAWYEVGFKVRGSVGAGKPYQKGTINWSDGSQSDTELRIEKGWNSASFSKPGLKPSSIKTGPGDHAFGCQTVYIKATAKDIMGNEKVLVDYDKFGAIRPNETFSVGDKLPSVPKNKTIEISSKNKASINMTTYGVDGVLDNDNIEYSTDYTCAVTPDPDKKGALIVDGSYLPKGKTSNVVVRANGKDVVILQITVTN